MVDDGLVYSNLILIPEKDVMDTMCSLLDLVIGPAEDESFDASVHDFLCGATFECFSEGSYIVPLASTEDLTSSKLLSLSCTTTDAENDRKKKNPVSHKITKTVLGIKSKKKNIKGKTSD